MSRLSSEVKRWGILLSLLFFAVITHTTLSNLDRFYVLKQQLLADPHFVSGNERWKQKNASTVYFDGTRLTISNSERATEEISQKLLIDTPAFVRFSAEAGSTAMDPDEKYWAGGAVTLKFLNESGEYYQHKNLVTLKVPAATRRYSRDVYLDEGVAGVIVALRLLRSHGDFSVSNPELSLLAEFPLYTKARLALMAGWGLVGLVLLFWLSRMLTRKILLVGIGIAAFALIGVLAPGELVTKLNNLFAAVIPDAVLSAMQSFLVGNVGSMSESASPSAGISKLGHFLVFLILGFFVGQACRKTGVIYGIAAVAVFAIVTEALQIFMHDRSSSIADLYLDLTGGLLGFALAALILSFPLRYRSQVRTRG